MASCVLLLSSGAEARRLEHRTMIVSPPADAAADVVPSDGSSDNTAFSQDNRDVRLLAYDSVATNLVPGDVNQRRDVFGLRKARGAGRMGGRLTRVSVSASGGEANGDSRKPALDGTTGWRPRCVTFESGATNLARGDSSPDWDIYLRDLKRRTTGLVSVGHGDAVNARIDGRCHYVAYEARGSVFVRELARRRTLRIAAGRNPDLQADGRGVVYDRSGQVYHRTLAATGRRGDGPLQKRGPERLVSDTRAGRPANGISGSAAVDDRGRYVAFESTATDLCTNRCRFGPYTGPGGPNQYPRPAWNPLATSNHDVNGPMSDVFRRSLAEPASRPGSMALVSYEWGGEQGNGPSNRPVISRAGSQIVFDSAATNLPGVSGFGDLNGTVRDVFSWYFSPRTNHRGRIGLESLSGSSFSRDHAFDGPSTNPSMSSRGNYIAFTSEQTGKSGETNGQSIPDVFMRFMGGSHEGFPTG